MKPALVYKQWRKATTSAAFFTANVNSKPCELHLAMFAVGGKLLMVIWDLAMDPDLPHEQTIIGGGYCRARNKKAAAHEAVNKLLSHRDHIMRRHAREAEGV